VCDGLDNDCDGLRDGFTEFCSNLTGPFPAGDPRNNPGSTQLVPPPIPQNVCHPGTKTCPANVGPPNSFGACLGEKAPGTEVCNGLDDDCDNKIDEGTGGADCSTNCGVGTTVCMNGSLQCNTTVAPDDDTCDGNDDDCDGMIDEDFVCDNPPNCECTQAGQCNAHQSCINGAKVCVGTPVAQESCNCADDNCNGQIDENVTCEGAGAACVDCQCALPCSSTEVFQCSADKTCHNNFCVADPCFMKDCPPVGGAMQVCQRSFPAGMLPVGTCVDACSLQQCGIGSVCIPATGECAIDNCVTFPEKCTANQQCVNGNCVTNPCFGVMCPASQYCSSGQCFTSCADVDCPSGQRCRFGVCETDPCGETCIGGTVCNDQTGQCQVDPCKLIQCPQGQWCDPSKNGQCEDDPCFGTTCPSPDQVCKGGTCFGKDMFNPEAGANEQHVTTGGGGGCSTGGGASVLLGLALLAFFGARRRKGGDS
jgi:MYXO-CTERM domain-containing protein